MTPTHYRSQNGKVTAITAMVNEHLANAISKLEQTRGDHHMLAALHAERKRRIAVLNG